MSIKVLAYLVLPLAVLFCIGSENSVAQPKQKSPDAQTVTVEKMIVASGRITLDLDLNRLNGTNAAGARTKLETLQFVAAPNSFFTVVVSDNVLRGPIPSMMEIASQTPANVPAPLSGSLRQLALEKLQSSDSFDLVIRDSKSGFVFFNIDGHQYNFDANTRSLDINGGRLLISPDFAKALGRPSEAGLNVGSFSVAASMYPIEVDTIVDGQVRSAVMPSLKNQGGGTEVGTNPGPDVSVGDLPAVSQAGSNGNFVGLGVGTTSCNYGAVDLNWFQLPSNDHPVIPQNLYRMSGGTSGTDRFEQIGQSWLKHAFTALTENVCSLGCNGVGGPHLGSGCSDPYSSGLNASQSGLGSRAWVNPFTGFYPRGDSTTPPNNHSGHSHTGTAHRVLVNVSDLNTSLNPGASYFAEGQYVTPHEYAWCQASLGQCNMYNNVSYRQFNVSGTTSFSFSPVASTVRQRPAILAWTGASTNSFEPAPGVDGIGFVGYKVTNTVPGVWHYEYAVYNENLDRAVASFSVPLGCGVTVTNLDFHMPAQHPGFANDGTVADAGYSSDPWTPNQTSSAVTWSCQSYAANQNANAIRWGTLYNFRFDSNKPPQAAVATLGCFKTGAPFTVNIQAPMPDPCTPLQMTSVVSRKTHGAAGDFDVNLPLTGTPGVEARNSSGNHTFVFTFTNNVISGTATVSAGTGSVSGTPVFASNTMTVLLTGVTDAQRITVTASGVTDTFGQTLPDTAVTAGILMGDVTQNGAVNASDVAMSKGQLGQAVSSSNFLTDVNANGAINAGDVSIVKSNVGAGLP